jgi:hypothetical protein
MQVTVLPPQPDGKQLTARHVVKTLGEHAAAFMLANNIRGFQKDDDYVLRDDLVMDILLGIACTTGLTRTQAKEFGFKIRVLTKAAGIKVSLSECFNLVARALGYHAYNLAHMCSDEEGFIENLWAYGVIINTQMLDADDDKSVMRTNRQHWRMLVDRRKKNSGQKIIKPDMSEKKSTRLKRERARPIEYRV